MIVFFGTRQVVRDDDRPAGGVQQCPQCGKLVVFRPRRARNFIHLFWIPLIPLGAGQPVIECPQCRTRFSVTA